MIPTEKYLVVELLPAETTTESGIYLPEDNNRATTGKVIAIGASEDETQYDIGDTVIFKEWSATEHKQNGQKYLIIKKEDILAYVKAN